ncbi:MAG: hypothetical protein IKL04_07635 [Lachnospiraceae bacterium]|jgi:hypothetical protein|nr:hypothetical protein [Lachnospiraceae bacterium]
MTRKRTLFTEQQIEILKQNPFTASVSESQIRFTVEFKRFLLNEREKNGTQWKRIFQKAGYDPEILGKTRILRIVDRVRAEAASPKGLHDTVAKNHFSKENERVQTQKAIRQLQEEVLRLQQQVDFLKKTQMLSVLDEIED